MACVCVCVYPAYSRRGGGGVGAGTPRLPHIHRQTHGPRKYTLASDTVAHPL